MDARVGIPIRREIRGLKLTEVGLGTSQLGNLFRETSDEEAEGAIRTAWDGGIRYFDTAPHYGLGLSERRVGSLLKERPDGEFIISTKVGRVLEENPISKGQLDNEGFKVKADKLRRWDFSRDGILRSVDDSLSRTGLDHFDILYLHDPDDHFEVASTSGIATLIELREQGVVSAIGAGMNHSAPLAELIRRSDIDVVMIAGELTLLDQAATMDLLPLARERRIAVVVAGVFNSGILSRDAPSDNLTFGYSQAGRQVVSRAKEIAELCRAHGVSLPAAAIAYPLRFSEVASVVVGARNATQVSETLDRYQSKIADELWEDLAAAGFIPAEHS